MCQDVARSFWWTCFYARIMVEYVPPLALTSCPTFSMGVLIRTRQYMQDKDFNSCFLFFPAKVGEESIPTGLPAGAMFFFDSCKRASSPPHHLYSGAGGFPIQSVQGRLSETLCQKRRGTTTASTFPSFAPTASPQPRIIWMTGSPISWNLHLYWTYRRTSHQKCIEHIEKQGQGY